MIRQYLLALERWIDDESTLLGMLKTCFVLAAIVAVIVVPMWWAVARNDTPSAEDRCLWAGGAWTISGHHTTYMPVLVGKVTVLQPRRVTDYLCVERGRVMEPQP